VKALFKYFNQNLPRVQEEQMNRMDRAESSRCPDNEQEVYIRGKFSCILTRKGRVILEKMIGTQLIKNPKVQYCVDKSMPLDLNLS
jgi:hypothetical protein